jgi:signal transduction histidine kinase
VKHNPIHNFNFLLSFLHRYKDDVFIQENKDRRRYILKVLLNGTLALVILAISFTTIEFLTLRGEYKGLNPIYLLLVGVFFLTMRLLTKWLPTLISYTFTILYVLLGTYVLYVWGTGVPQGLLTYALVIVMSGALLGTRVAFFTTVLLSAILVILNYWETHGITQPNLYWMGHMSSFHDVIIFAFNFLIILFVSWVSNREIAKSLHRARASEATLLHERDLLEVKVKERTKELQKAQQQELSQLYRLAQFGRMSSELLHDLVDPLSSIALNLEKITHSERSDLIHRALEGTHKMEQFVSAARKQIQSQRQVSNFVMQEVVQEVIQVLHAKAERQRVRLLLEEGKSFSIYADPVRFHKLVSNLVSNAIDSFEGTKKKERTIFINLTKQDYGFELAVRDTGKGIPAHVLKHVLEPFYTTKPAGRGLGLGLSICKEIVEQEFKGSFKIESVINKGSTVYAYLKTQEA